MLMFESFAIPEYKPLKQLQLYMQVKNNPTAIFSGRVSGIPKNSDIMQEIIGNTKARDVANPPIIPITTNTSMAIPTFPYALFPRSPLHA